MILLQSQPFDTSAMLAGFGADEETGAIVTFTGQCRADGGKTEALELEIYAGFTEAEIEKTAEAAKARFSLHDLIIAHRVGRVTPGETIVFVATTATHRREAFDAAEYLMDYLKSRAPFWKKAHETGGAHWIDPKAQDYQDAARWDAQQEK